MPQPREDSYEEGACVGRVPRSYEPRLGGYFVVFVPAFRFRIINFLRFLAASRAGGLYCSTGLLWSTGCMKRLNTAKQIGHLGEDEAYGHFRAMASFFRRASSMYDGHWVLL